VLLGGCETYELELRGKLQDINLKRGNKEGATHPNDKTGADEGHQNTNSVQNFGKRWS
jgi:hypothetical protein